MKLTPETETPVLNRPAVKCVVWDLDDTLWHGVLLENDLITLREGIVEVIQTLDSLGIIHSISSKNNYSDAMRMLEAFGLKDYFLYPQVNWDLKSSSLKTIQEKLNISMDTIAFIDDQAFERDEVAFVHPEVRCYDVTAIPELTRLFQPRFVTDESALRRKMYLINDQRNQEEKEIGNNRNFLESLDLEFSISLAGEEDLQRVEELTLRTSQLNATGYAYSYEELKNLLQSPDHKLFVAELKDKYGSYGKIGVALVECSGEHWTLKLLLMSCRVMSRGVGGTLLNYIINTARGHHARLFAEFLPTHRNRLMYVTYKFAGFNESGKLENGGVLLEHTLEESAPYPDYMKLSIKAPYGELVSR